MSPLLRFPVEARCRECGLEIQEGELLYRSLDVHDKDPEPYCPSCQGDDLEFREAPAESVQEQKNDD